ncbi:MAG: ComF family protein [Pseudomonadota bacterium]
MDLIYPPRCPVCGVAVAKQGGLCIDCWSDLETPSNEHDGVVAATIYNDASRQLVLNFKHGGKISLAGLLGRMMAQRMPDADGEGDPLLVPVPLHRLRLWERGFNQAALLARELARRGKGELCVDALIRHKRTPSLGGLGRDARANALKGAIGVRPSRRARIVGRDIALIDDVFTSGATSSACTKALMEAGARSVQVVCFSRVAEG